MRITKIARDEWNHVYRLNFFMDNLHYSIQYEGDCGEVFLILRCKETKDVVDISETPYYADGELDDWLFGWNNYKRGNNDDCKITFVTQNPFDGQEVKVFASGDISYSENEADIEVEIKGGW